MLLLDSAFVRSWIRVAAADVAAHRDYLTQLDAAIGDADHGVNMDRGFAAALLALDGDPAIPPGLLLEAVGDAIVFKVGGAVGPALRDRVPWGRLRARRRRHVRR